MRTVFLVAAGSGFCLRIPSETQVATEHSGKGGMKVQEGGEEMEGWAEFCELLFFFEYA